MKKKIFRIFICFLVVCCLLVRISPIQAEAIDALSVVGISAGLAITTGLIGLGLQAGGTSKALQEISGSAVSAIESGEFGEFISNGLVNAVKYNRGDGTYGFALSLGLLEALKTWIFGEEIVVSDSPSLSTNFSCTFNGQSYSFSGVDPFALACVTGEYLFSEGSYFTAYYLVLYSESSNYISGRALSLNEAGCYSFIVNSTTSSTAYEQYISSCGANIVSLGKYDSSTVLRSAVQNYGFFGGDTVTTPYDLTLGAVGTADQTVEEAHSDWVAGSIAVPGSLVGSDTEEKYVPVGLPADQTEALGKTQEEVQSGVGTYDDTLADTETDSDAVTGTGTIADVIAEIKALPTTFADTFAEVVAAVKAIPAAIADVFTPSGTVEAYSLDLKRFFPFCIPYDIYSMLAALAADPVAPNFDFEIDLGPVGILPISVDFSEWDDVAALLRTCEAAIFAVGLAVKTKELIGW